MTISATGSRDKGFTLIEILMSVAILSIGTVLVMQALARAAWGITAAEHRRQACLFSLSKMAEAELTLRTMKELEEHSGGSFQADQQAFVWNLSSMPETEGSPRRLISLAVTWEDGAHRYEHRVQTVLASSKRPDEIQH